MDAETIAPAGSSGPVATDAPPARRPWRLRHPVAARACLYGSALALLAAGGVVWQCRREAGRQDGLLTIIQGAEQVRVGAPEVALATIREQVLAKSPNADVRRRALLSEAATLDQLERFGEAEAAYASVSASWPESTPRGALVVPWAMMRVRARRPVEALALLDAPGATEGAPESDVASVREWAAKPAGTAPKTDPPPKTR
jgi:hypothetical protein